LWDGSLHSSKGYDDSSSTHDNLSVRSKLAIHFKSIYPTMIIELLISEIELCVQGYVLENKCDPLKYEQNELVFDCKELNIKQHFKHHTNSHITISKEESTSFSFKKAKKMDIEHLMADFFDDQKAIQINMMTTYPINYYDHFQKSIMKSDVPIQQSIENEENNY